MSIEIIGEVAINQIGRVVLDTLKWGGTALDYYLQRTTVPNAKLKLKRYWWWPIDQRSSTLNLDLIDVRIPTFVILSFLQTFIPVLIDTANETYSAKITDFGSIDSLCRHYNQYMKLMLSIVLLGGWFIGILVILCQFINDQDYVSVFMLCGPLVFKGVVFLFRTFDMVSKLKRSLGQNFTASYYEIYQASRQHVLTEDNLKNTGETTVPRIIRSEVKEMGTI